MEGNDLISSLKGVGDKTTAYFHRLKLDTIEDLVQFYPKCYLTYEEPILLNEAQEGERMAFRLMISSPILVRLVKKFKIVTCTAEDLSGKVTLMWYNMPFLKKTLHAGQTWIFVGTPVYKKGRLTIEHPEYYTEEQYERMRVTLQPVYSLTEGLTNKTVQKAMIQVMPYIKSQKEYMPKAVIEKYQFWSYSDALAEVHFPVSKERLIEAKKRLIFDEFFLFLNAMYLMKEQTIVVHNHYKIMPSKETKALLQSLPYSLTGAQMRAYEEIKGDLSSKKIMNRLVQGDVGSGKTILAVLALLDTVKAGYQGALMVPTEVLARQHYETIESLLAPYNVRVGLLTGATKMSEKRVIYEQLKNHELDLIIGTHALIQEQVEYANLALVITDEQHRFGVRQREALASKGKQPHVLVMSATPIPRTLAIILYGDLDISVIDELPANRLPIKNCVVDTSYRPKAYRFIENQVELGRQVYVICPMVEESETIEAENVTDYTVKLQQQLRAGIRVACLNGKMKQANKQEIMEQFSRHEIDVLVSTTVIEVGINVPNATVMMVENAERFGLAQLHQLRGRVGRGGFQSYCIFMSGSKKQETMERLSILNKSNDGFFIANEDLRLRGPGDFFGIRQSGILDFVLADVYDHADLLKMADDAMKWLIKQGWHPRELDSEKFKKKLEGALQL